MGQDVRERGGHGYIRLKITRSGLRGASVRAWQGVSFREKLAGIWHHGSEGSGVCVAGQFRGPGEW